MMKTTTPVPANILDMGELEYKVLDDGSKNTLFADDPVFARDKWVKQRYSTSMLIQFASVEDFKWAIAEKRVDLTVFTHYAGDTAETP